MGNPENLDIAASPGFTTIRLCSLARNSLTMLVYFFACSVFPLPGQDITTERELALQTPEVLFDPEESLYSRTQSMFQSIPGIEWAANGRLWVAYVSGGTGEGSNDNYVSLITSGDDGQTWSDLKIIVDMPDKPVRIHSPCLWIDPLGRLWFFWTQSYNPWGHCGTWAMVTENPGDAEPVRSEPRRLFQGTILNKRTVLSNGDWLFPVNLKNHLSKYDWEGKEETWERTGNTDILSSIAVMKTNDFGETFTFQGIAGQLDSADFSQTSEPMIVEREDGTLWMLVRMRYGMGESVSTDGGCTWSPIEQSSVRHPVARFFLRRLQSENLILVKHGPINERTRREQLTAYISEDEGATWKAVLKS